MVSMILLFVFFFVCFFLSQCFYFLFSDLDGSGRQEYA
jgi:hypothetical protein